MQRAAHLAFALFLVAGCGSPANNNNGQEGTPDMAEAAAPVPDMAVALYPGCTSPNSCPGPYGINEGDVLFNLTAKGYHLNIQQTDESQLTYEDVQIGELHANPACKCMMLSQSATWCGPCNAEQPELVQAVTDDPSFCVFNVLVDGPTPGIRPTPQDVANWNDVHAQNFPIVGANIQTYLHLPSPKLLPTNVVIDPRTMKILAINAGLGPTTIDDAKALCAGM